MTYRDALKIALEALSIVADVAPHPLGPKAMKAVADAIHEVSIALAAPQPEPKGYVRNCELTQRRGPSEPDWIFYVDAAGNTYCQLDGYRIMPIDAPQPAVAAIISGLREQIEEQKLAILRSWDYGKHLEGEAMLWEERARHLGWRDEHGA